MISASGGAPTEDVVWYKNWKYWAIILIIVGILWNMYMRGKN
jgi:hypothetical protein